VSVEDLMLLPYVRARRALDGRNLRLRVLAPFGAWAGRGALRVLRLKMHDDESAELTIGYESYDRLDAAP
jgi:hypothetical protein